MIILGVFRFFSKTLPTVFFVFDYSIFPVFWKKKKKNFRLVGLTISKTFPVRLLSLCSLTISPPKAFVRLIFLPAIILHGSFVNGFEFLNPSKRFGFKLSSVCILTRVTDICYGPADPPNSPWNPGVLSVHRTRATKPTGK